MKWGEFILAGLSFVAASCTGMISASPVEDSAKARSLVADSLAPTIVKGLCVAFDARGISLDQDLTLKLSKGIDASSQSLSFFSDSDCSSPQNTFFVSKNATATLFYGKAILSGSPQFSLVEDHNLVRPVTLSLNVLADPSLSIFPQKIVLLQSEILSFQGVGGWGTLSFATLSGGVTIPFTGAYTAPNSLGTESVRVQDAVGSSALAQISISQWNLANDYVAGGTAYWNQPYAMKTAPDGAIYSAGLSGTSNMANQENWHIIASTDSGSTWGFSDSFTLAANQASAAVGLGAALGHTMFAAGWATDAGGVDHWIVRITQNSGTLWQTVRNLQYVAGYSSRALGVVRDIHNNVYVCGYAYDQFNQMYWMVEKTSDEGMSWTRMQALRIGATDSLARAMLVLPDNSLFVLGNTLDGTGFGTTYIRRSLDQGVTWTQVDSYALPGGQGCRTDGTSSNVSLSADSAKNLFYDTFCLDGSGTGTSIFRKIAATSGQTSTLLSLGSWSINPVFYVDLNDHLFAITRDFSQGQDAHIWVSRDSGLNWTSHSLLLPSDVADMAQDLAGNYWIAQQVWDGGMAHLHWNMKKFGNF